MLSVVSLSVKYRAEVNRPQISHGSSSKITYFPPDALIVKKKDDFFLSPQTRSLEPVQDCHSLGFGVEGSRLFHWPFILQIIDTMEAFLLSSL